MKQEDLSDYIERVEELDDESDEVSNQEGDSKDKKSDKNWKINQDSSKSSEQDVNISFQNDEYLKERMHKKTKEEKQYNEEHKDNSSQEKDSKSNENQEQGESQSTYEESGQTDREYYDDMAELIIDLLNDGLAEGLAWFSIQGSSNEFEISKARSDKLKQQLGYILWKHQSRISIEFIFVLTLLVTLGPLISKSWKMRQDYNSGDEYEDDSNLGVTYSQYRDDDSSKNKDDNNIEDVEYEEVKTEKKEKDKSQEESGKKRWMGNG